jgi:hypothetical protein
MVGGILVPVRDAETSLLPWREGSISQSTAVDENKTVCGNGGILAALNIFAHAITKHKNYKDFRLEV